MEKAIKLLAESAARKIGAYNSLTVDDPIIRGEIYGMIGCFPLLGREVDWQLDTDRMRFTFFAVGGVVYYKEV